VLEARLHCARVGTTSFTLATEFRRWPDGEVLVTAETVLVSTHHRDGTKLALTDEQRRKLLAGAPGVVVDHAGVILRGA